MASVTRTVRAHEGRSSAWLLLTQDCVGHPSREGREEVKSPRSRKARDLGHPRKFKGVSEQCGDMGTRPSFTLSIAGAELGLGSSFCKQLHHLIAAHKKK